VKAGEVGAFTAGTYSAMAEDALTGSEITYNCTLTEFSFPLPLTHFPCMACVAFVLTDQPHAMLAIYILLNDLFFVLILSS
jgi:hypothetical protein